MRMLTFEAQQRVVASLINKHPLPWRIQQDWTWEILDANNDVVAKCKMHADALEIVTFATEYDKEISAKMYTKPSKKLA